MIAWGQVMMHRVLTTPRYCRGFLIDDQGDALAKVHPVLESLGFRVPIPTGSRCGVYESDDAAFISKAGTDEPPGLHVFRLGGPDAGRLRSILGEIAAETSVEVKIKRWTPPLA